MSQTELPPLELGSDEELPDRMRVIEHIYHYRRGEGPQGISTNYARDLRTKEQLYQRSTKATSDWRPLDRGWIESVGRVILVNRGDSDLELAAESEPQGVWIIPPGESMSGLPKNFDSFQVRSTNGETKYSIYVLPD